jgi:hypothetical protein
MKSLGLSDEFPASRGVHYLEAADRSVLQRIGCGVLFVMAFWSVPARVAFAALKRVLTEIDPEGRLELFVVDIDGFPELAELPEFRGKVAGAGEAAWVKDGRIVSTAVQNEVQAYGPNTVDLLARCPLRAERE